MPGKSPSASVSHAKQGKPKLAIMVVAYYAESTIRNLLERIPADIRERAAEIIVLDDASKDRTAEVARAAGKEWGWKNLTVIHNEQNLGYGGNQKKGYRMAIEKGYDIIVMLHGDAQYGPEQIPGLIAPLEDARADMSFGSRMTGAPLKGGMPLWKYCGNKFLTVYANAMLGERLSEYHSGFRAYRVDALRTINLDNCSNQFVFDTDIVLELKRHGFRFAETTIPTHYGPESRQIQLFPVIRYGLQIMKRVTNYAVSKPSHTQTHHTESAAMDSPQNAPLSAAHSSPNPAPSPAGEPLNKN